MEQNQDTAAIARAGDCLPYVRLRLGDAEQLLSGLGRFDLIFADAEGGKWSGLDLTIAALRPGGVLMVDDMDPNRYEQADHRSAIARVRETIVGHRGLIAVELPVSTGVILAAAVGAAE